MNTNSYKVISMKKLSLLFSLMLLLTFSHLSCFAQQGSKGLLVDKRLATILSPLEKIHFYGSTKQYEIAKIRKLTDAEILCLYEDQMIDSIENSGWEWNQTYHFDKNGKLARYTEEGEGFLTELSFVDGNLVQVINIEHSQKQIGKVTYTPIGGGTYLLQIRDAKGERVFHNLDGSKVTFDAKGHVISIAYTNDEGHSYSTISKFHYDKFGNARNDQGQLCIPMLGDINLSTYTKLIIKESSKADIPYTLNLQYGLDLENDSMSNITLFIRNFDLNRILSKSDIW